MDFETLNYVVHHIFFPIRRPQDDDQAIAKDLAICDLIIDRGRAFQKLLLSPTRASAWEPIVKMSERLRELLSTNALDREMLLAWMKALKPGDVVVIPVRTQNACVIVRKMPGKVYFESFEVNPPNEEIMVTVGRVIRHFPESAISVPDETAMDPFFQRELVNFLVNIDVELQGSAPMTIKAKSRVVETRDTADPHYITQLFTAILRGQKDSCQVDVDVIEKHTRDEILWNDAAKPWRRSSHWLITRVVIQSTLCRIPASPGRSEFKAFMLYLMTSIPLSNNCGDLSSDSLECMGAKLARRLKKLSAEAPDFDAVAPEVSKAVGKIRGILDLRWKKLQSCQKESPLWDPNQLDIKSDTHLSLDKSRDYIHSRLLNPPAGPPYEFTPHENPRLIDILRDPDAFTSTNLTSTNLSAALSTDPIIALLDLEQFVASDLGGWVNHRLHHHLEESACVTLADCIDVYAASASEYYTGNPEGESIKLLTMLQMWVALDQLATAQHPLLLDYSPEIPQNLLEPLLLRDMLFVEKFKDVQSYLCGRHKKECKGSIFEEIVVSTSFAIRYFNDSSELKLLKVKIEADAHASRRKKSDELQEKKREYESRVKRAEGMEHEYYYARHDRWCSKCSLRDSAQEMSIEVHEWPLPRDDLFAKAVVFELKCPVAFRTWRTTTYAILYDFCRPSQPLTASADPPVVLADYGGLRQYVGETSRVTYASSTKSFLKAHYYSQRVHLATEASICVNNGLAFQLFDTVRRRWAVKSFQDCAVDELCTYVLPSKGPYHKLQDALRETTYSPNRAIVGQSEAPTELSLHEHLAFSSLRSGPRLQWLNIARELRTRVLSFSWLEVQMLIAQTAWQVGPVFASSAPDWHTSLQCPSFGERLLAEVEDLLSTIEGNWGHVMTLQIIIWLVARLLNFATEKPIIDRACEVLRHGRRVALTWMKSLSDSLDVAENEIVVDDFQRRLCAMAATCRATFDVDSCHLDRLLKSDADVKELVYCLVRVHDNTPPNNPFDDLRRLLARDIRLSHSILSAMWTIAERSRGGLDDAITEIWKDYRCGSDWQRLPQPNDRWITTSTSAAGSSEKSTVHLNLLDGTLLINGRPLKRLPPSIIQHPTYRRILGSKILDIIPSNLPGMDFATRIPIPGSGFDFHFKLQEPENNLIIQAKRDCEIYELIPDERFNQDFPIFFVQDYAHWLQLWPGPGVGFREIEFRPLEARWSPSPDNWRLNFSTSPTGTSTMTQGKEYLIDIRTPTFSMIANRLKPLEGSGYIHVTTIPSDESNLLASLPRYKLSFFLHSSGKLESSNFRGASIDVDQSTGTMVGLSSQLVLSQNNAADSDLIRSRFVIIPFGNVQSNKSSMHHVTTHISIPENSSSVQYFRYDIDMNLGRLIGTTLLSDLYKIYLHAVTSYPLPDPLTGRTGTEEALSDLNSARCLSFRNLGSEEYRLLCDIAKLSPHQKWYPDHLHVMQSIQWREINPLAQHWGFRTVVQSILDFHNKLDVFKKDQTPPLSIPGYDHHLHERSASRNYNLYTSDCAFFEPSQAHDKRYLPVEREVRQRVLAPSLDTIRLSANVAASVQQWPQRLSTVPDLWERMKSFGGPLVHRRSTGLSLSFASDFLKPSLADLWLFLYDRCHQTSTQKEKQYQLTFTLAAFAYGSPNIHALLPTILAFASTPNFSDIHPLEWNSYNLDEGITPDDRRILELLKSYAIHISRSPSNNLPRFNHETSYEYQIRCEAHHNTAYTSEARGVVEDIMSQWPCETPSWKSPGPSLIDLSSDLKGQINQLFQDWYKNLQLHAHVQIVQQCLDSVRSDSSLTVPAIVDELRVPTILPPEAPPRYSVPNMVHSLQQSPPSTQCLPPPPSSLPHDSEGLFEESDSSGLDSVINDFTNGCALRRRYGQALGESLVSRQNERLVKLKAYCKECHVHFEETLNLVTEALLPLNLIEKVGHQAGQWPRLTIRLLLGILSATSKHHVSGGWRSTMVFLAQSLLRYQRAQRLVRHCSLNAIDDLRKEYVNDLTSQSESDAPEWLLIQIEGNFLLRPIQRQVSREMMSPSSPGGNTLLQLNMGEGKSSVIVPIISSSLADGKQLVRVVVLKSLANQMFDLLVRRLSGLTNRRVFYLPFSRGGQVAAAGKDIQALFELCMQERGILLVQPEHILSFKLMGIDLAIRDEDQASRDRAETFLTSQSWLDRFSRDILDESDEILSVKYQLVYTSGAQESLEDHPDRWIRIQKILNSAKTHARWLQETKPQALKVESTEEGVFPIIRILDAHAGKLLSERVAEDVLARIEQYRLLPEDSRRAALSFVTCGARGDETDTSVLDRLWNTGLWKSLLHLRGILGLGILQFALQKKRWRVDYGLDPTRTVLAVPYRAKDVPTLRADFGHPDVAVTLTCLSYYYGGLKDEQLDLCFELLFKLDNPALEYEAWVAGCNGVPQYLTEIIGVNLDDLSQREEHLRLFRKTQAVIDFYLSNVVFPKEAKQFTSRLATSSWDLAESKERITTGFSGTNDNRDLLPTSIKQCDPVNQLGTNAKVLGYLLRQENDRYFCLHKERQFLSSCDILEFMVEHSPPVRVLLDVGAQMLDMQTTTIARTWLSLATDIEAIVFFDEEQLVVMNRDHDIELLVLSQFNDKLDVCGIYLDDAHTRGTDLRLPKYFRAAVTLGPHLTKDRLVQGCMRMRKLGHGQSLVFLAPQEVDRAIRDSARLDPSGNVKTLDILYWTMSETCDYIQHHLAHWAHQGVEYKKRREAWAAYEKGPSATGAIDKLRSSWVEPDARSLEDMYGSRIEEEGQHPAFEIDDLRERLDALGISLIGNAKVDEEQEREVSQEIEQERQVERPPPAGPAKHLVHDHIRQLVTHGEIHEATIASSPAFVPLFSPLQHRGDHEWSPSLWTTKDFAITIVGSALEAEKYQRPVHWLLSLKRQEHLIAISPYEANELLPLIHTSKFVHLHIYAPRVTQAMKTFEDLDFFCIPPLPEGWVPPSLTDITQLNLFAGQLYLKNYDTYTRLRMMLGLIGDETKGENGQWWDNDGFVRSEKRRGKMQELCKLSSSPLPFLEHLIGLRRKGMGYQLTHMGRIIHGGLLTREDFEKYDRTKRKTGSATEGGSTPLC